jgi:hypothetical protein
VKSTVAVGLLLLSYSACVLAQEALVGQYSGFYVGRTNSGVEVREHLTLEIKSAQDGKLQGTATRFYDGIVRHGGYSQCRGDYVLEGTYQDNNIVLESIGPGGHAGDCRTTLRLVVEGDKLIGRMNKLRAELSRK